MNVLVVEDSPTSRAAINHTLAKNGHNVVEAVNGKDGLEKLQGIVDDGEQVDFIICDINMPVMNGLDFIAEVKKDDQHKYIPLLFLTTETERELIERGKALGASTWLIKPFQPQQLSTLINKFAK